MGAFLDAKPETSQLSTLPPQLSMLLLHPVNLLSYSSKMFSTLITEIYIFPWLRYSSMMFCTLILNNSFFNPNLYDARRRYEILKNMENNCVQPIFPYKSKYIKL